MCIRDSDEIDLHASLRSAIQGLNHVLVEQGVHFGNDASGAALTRVVGLAIDQCNDFLREIKRSHQKRVIARVLGIGGEETEDVMHGAGNLRIRREQAEVGINAVSYTHLDVYKRQLPGRGPGPG